MVRIIRIALAAWTAAFIISAPIAWAQPVAATPKPAVAALKVATPAPVAVAAAVATPTPVVAAPQGTAPSGSLSGVVLDTAGRYLPDVRVVAKHSASGAASQAVTTSQGRFTMPALDAGTYTVTCSLQDFKPVVLSDVKVMANTPATVKATLVESQAGAEQVPSRPPAPPKPPQPPQPAQTPQTPKPAKPPTAPEPGLPLSSAPESNMNVRVDVTITDQAGSAPPTKKTVSLTVSDGGRGSVRSGVTVPIPSTTFATAKEGDLPKPLTSFSYRDMGLSLDVTSVHVRGNYVRLRLAVEYNPVDEKMASIEQTAAWLAQGPASFARFSQTLDLALENGKPLIVASSSDPVPSRNRTASLEVKATILK